MKRRFTASRIGGESAIFPARIICEDSTITLQIPGLFNDKESKFLYTDVTQVSKDCPLVGWSTISFTVNSVRVDAKGFTKGDVESIERLIMEGKSNTKPSTPIDNGYTAREANEAIKAIKANEEYRLKLEERRLALEEQRLRAQMKNNSRREHTPQPPAEGESRRKETPKGQNKDIYSQNIDISLKQLLIDIAQEDISIYTDKSSITKRLRNISRVFSKFLTSNDTNRKVFICREFDWALDKFEMLIEALEETDGDMPEINTFRDKATQYKNNLEEVVEYDNARRAKSKEKFQKAAAEQEQRSNEYRNKMDMEEKIAKIRWRLWALIFLGSIASMFIFDLEVGAIVLLILVAIIALCVVAWNLLVNL